MASLRRAAGLISAALPPALAVVAVMAGMTACTADRFPVIGETSGAAGYVVRFSAKEVPFLDVTGTKAVTTSLSSFYCCVSVPVTGRDVQVVANREFELVGSDFRSDPETYWPGDEGPTWQFDCASKALTWTSGGYTVDIGEGEDVVVAHVPYPLRHVKNTVTFVHPFAYINDVVVTAEAGWTLSGVSLTLTPVVSGTYNLKEGHGMTDGTGWSDTAEGDPVNIAPSTAGTSHPDLLLVPGTYEVTAAWTATDGVTPKSFSDMVTTIDVVGGKNNVLSFTLGGTQDNG